MHLIPINCGKKIFTRLLDGVVEVEPLQERLDSFPFPAGKFVLMLHDFFFSKVKESHLYN